MLASLSFSLSLSLSSPYPLSLFLLPTTIHTSPLNYQTDQVGCLIVIQEIYKDRKKFSKAVFEVASSDLVNMGIYVVSYTLKDIRDEEVSTLLLSVYIWIL